MIIYSADHENLIIDVSDILAKSERPRPSDVFYLYLPNLELINVAFVTVD